MAEDMLTKCECECELECEGMEAFIETQSETDQHASQAQHRRRVRCCRVDEEGVAVYAKEKESGGESGLLYAAGGVKVRSGR